MNKRILSLIIAIIMLLHLSGLIAGAVRDDSFDGWVGAWSTSPVHSGVSPGGAAVLTDYIPANSTVRSVFTLTIGGSKVRIKFSNKFGSVNLYIGEASVAKTNPGDDEAIVFDTARQLTFSGSTSVTVPAGGSVWSDPVRIDVSALEKLTVSAYYPYMTYITTAGLCGAHTSMSTPTVPIGSQVTWETLTSASRVNITSNTITYNTTPFITNCDVYTGDPNTYSVVMIGDSTLANDIPLMFAQKLNANGITNVGVLQQAIVGNRLLADGVGLLGPLYGKALLDRFEEDCLEQTRAKVVLIKIGLNDILHPTAKSMKGKAKYVTDDQILEGYSELARRAREKGMKVYFFTKTPVKGYLRDFVFQKGDIEWHDSFADSIALFDDWVMTTDEIDGYIDVYNVRDAYDLDRFVPSFTDDWIHPELLGQIAIADDIPLSVVGSNKTYAKTVASIYGVDPFARLSAVAQRGVPELTTAAPATTVPVATAPAAEEPATAAPVPATQPQNPAVPAATATPGVVVPLPSNNGNAGAPIVTQADGASYALYSYAITIPAATQPGAVTGEDGAEIATAPVPAGTAEPGGDAGATAPAGTAKEPVDRSMSTGTKVGIAAGLIMLTGAAVYGIIVAKSAATCRRTLKECLRSFSRERT
ncbi:MAG: hypothetical protein K6C36_00825 [Clostridia bacterium]|nr:hypothetical protein [Clostridia bacterium]